MIGFKGQEVLVAEVVGDLLDPIYGRSWNVAIPPGFGEDTFIKNVWSALLQPKGEALVAVVAPDSVPSIAAYIESLHAQWSSNFSMPALPVGERADTTFDFLLAALPGDKPVVQVIRRFHSVLDCFEEWLLGKLRDAETQKKIRTLTVTPVELPELKRRWESEGHVLVVSDYGDTHTLGEVEPLGNDEMISALNEMSVPNGVASYLIALSGGYPEIVSELATFWIRRGKPPLRPDVRRELRQLGTGRFARFVKWLDRKGVLFNRDYVIDLYQGFEAEEAYSRLSNHPWRNILFSEDFVLRAECLGEAAIHDAMRMASVSNTSEHVALETEKRAQQMYTQRQYGHSLAMLENISFLESFRPELKVLRATAKIMEAMLGRDGPSEDTDWRAVLRNVVAAQELLKPFPVTKNSRIEMLNTRLAELQEVSESLAQVQKPTNVRLVDLLCGLVGSNTLNPRIGLLLLMLKYKSCTEIPGAASACQNGLYLPEQIFRIWAFWELEVNYYSAPSGQEAAWAIAAAKWPSERNGELRIAIGGAEFPSLLAFAYFCQAKVELAQAESRNSAVPLLTSFTELESVFSRYEQIRNPKAHSYCYTTTRSRDDFFKLIDSWLDCLVAVCPERTSRIRLLALIEDLPICNREDFAS